ncbi:MAG: hypothetical protein EXR75_11335 [Myxococcales bacterium]|nr:hypothetical protein [Myxococcales bacterium]
MPGILNTACRRGHTLPSLFRHFQRGSDGGSDRGTVLVPALGLATLTLTLALALAKEADTFPGDPGPSAACPADMRLVEGAHYEHVAHVCLDERKDKKDSHCFAYAEDVSVLDGPVTELRVCMDRFEAPNAMGQKPMVMQSFEMAERWCAKRKKRVCSEQEWELACEGPGHRALAYGWSVNVRACNSNKGWRPVDFAAFDGPREGALKEAGKLWQGTPSGRYASCVSPFGVVDMMGNVEEWVKTRSGRAWPGALMGGFWAKPWTGCRGTNDAHQPTFAFYETGFRCCRSAEESPPP